MEIFVPDVIFLNILILKEKDVYQHVIKKTLKNLVLGQKKIKMDINAMSVNQLVAI